MTNSLSVRVPSSKSIANRVLILAALSNGRSILKGDFEAEDIQLMINALQKLGIHIAQKKDRLVIRNDLSWRKSASKLTLNLGNSGTCMRFLTALCCLRKGVTVLTGKPRMKERPVMDLVNALRQLGAEIRYLEHESYPPIAIRGNGSLLGGPVSMEGNVSSQFISALLLCSNTMNNPLEIRFQGALVSKPYIDLTNDVLSQWTKRRKEFRIEPDASAAVYFWAYNFLHGSSITIANLPDDSVQPDAQFQNVLSSLSEHKKSGHRWIFTIDMSDMPDSSLMLMALAPLLSFPVLIKGLGTLRVKETDRIHAMKTELKKLGVRVETGRDWMKIFPGIVYPKRKISIDTYDDHRIAMSFGILGTKIPNSKILGANCVQKTYPNFWRDLGKIRNFYIPNVL